MLSVITTQLCGWVSNLIILSMYNIITEVGTSESAVVDTDMLVNCSLVCSYK